MESIVVIIIVAVICYFKLSPMIDIGKQQKINTNLKKQDGIVKDRKNIFMREKHIFRTSVNNMNQIKNLLNIKMIQEQNILITQSDKEDILRFNWTLDDSYFTAYLVEEDGSEDFNEYHFFVAEGSASDDNRFKMFALNVVLTDIEKVLVQLDPKVEVNRQLMEYERHTKFF